MSVLSNFGTSNAANTVIRKTKEIGARMKGLDDKKNVDLDQKTPGRVEVKDAFLPKTAAKYAQNAFETLVSPIGLISLASTEKVSGTAQYDENGELQSLKATTDAGLAGFSAEDIGLGQKLDEITQGSYQYAKVANGDEVFSDGRTTVRKTQSDTLVVLQEKTPNPESFTAMSAENFEMPEGAVSISSAGFLDSVFGGSSSGDTQGTAASSTSKEAAPSKKTGEKMEGKSTDAPVSLASKLTELSESAGIDPKAVAADLSASFDQGLKQTEKLVGEATKSLGKIFGWGKK